MCYNIFNQLHNPLKSELLNTCVLLETNPNTTKEHRERFIKKVSEVLTKFKDQVKQEDAFVLPLVFEYEPSIWDIYTYQHKNLCKLMTHLDMLIFTFQKEDDENKKKDLLNSIFEYFNEFVLMNYHHLDDEEKILSEILGRYYSNDFLKQVDHQIKMQKLLVAQQSNSIYPTANAA